MDIIYGSGVALARICFSVFSKCKVEGKESIHPEDKTKNNIIRRTLT